MRTPTSREIDCAIDAQHPDAGVVVLDARGGRGRPYKVGYRERDDEAVEDVMDMVVLRNPPPGHDPRGRRSPV
ncbi:MAG: hypothetical protein QOI84_660 [Solirubrobacterales bacterium]|nr:hypothetical protein [Solirubrobacterales bacterium]